MIIKACDLEYIITTIQSTRNAKGTFFSVKNVKRDGSVRIWNCRLGVRKGTRGGSIPYDSHDKGLIPVWDRTAMGFRQIAVETITELTVCGNSVIKNGIFNPEYNALRIAARVKRQINGS